MAVTRARELRWLRLESSGKGGSNQSAAAEAGLKQGSAGYQGWDAGTAAVKAGSGHGCGRTAGSGHGCTGSFRARRGEENAKCLFGQTPTPPPPPPPPLNRPVTAAEGSLPPNFRYF